MGVLWSPPSLTLILQSSELEGEEGLLLSGEGGRGQGAGQHQAGPWVQSDQVRGAGGRGVRVRGWRSCRWSGFCGIVAVSTLSLSRYLFNAGGGLIKWSK